MSEQSTTADVAPETPAGSAVVTDDQASALLADAVAAAELDESTLDERSQKVIAAIRNDFKAERTKRQAAESVASTAEAARNEFAQTIGKAVGLIKDDEPADPAALTAQLTTAGAEARQAKVELAVFRAAQATDADPSALLDSRAFLAKLADVDPSDTAAVTAAITEAVTANPRLGKPVTPGMKPNPAQGRSASAPLGIAEQIAASEKAGDTKATIRLKAAMGLNSN
jgi:hypothetical protein